MQVLSAFIAMIAGLAKEANDFAVKDHFSNRHRMFRLSTKDFFYDG